MDATVQNSIPEIEAMRMGVDYSFRVSLRQFSCILRPLSNSEFIECYNRVEAHINQLPPHARTETVRSNGRAREFLKAASGTYGAPYGTITDPILDRMSNEELMYFYNEWLAVCDKVNPNIEKMDVEQIKQLVEDVKKNPPADLDSQLTELSFGQIRNILSYLLTKGD